MFTTTKIFKNPESNKCAVVFIHNIKYIISTDDETIVSNHMYEKTLKALGYTEEISSK